MLSAVRRGSVSGGRSGPRKRGVYDSLLRRALTPQAKMYFGGQSTRDVPWYALASNRAAWKKFVDEWKGE